jgi:hypothetical protein
LIKKLIKSALCSEAGARSHVWEQRGRKKNKRNIFAKFCTPLLGVPFLFTTETPDSTIVLKLTHISITKSEESTRFKLAYITHKLNIIIRSAFYCFHMEPQATCKVPRLRCVEIYTTPTTTPLHDVLTYTVVSSRLYNDQHNDVSSIQPSTFLQNEYEGLHTQVSFPVSSKLLSALIRKNKKFTKKQVKSNFLSPSSVRETFSKLDSNSAGQ